MKATDFNEGDLVEYELAPDEFTKEVNGMSRWTLGSFEWTDQGPSNKFTKGIVKKDKTSDNENLIMICPETNCFLQIVVPCDGHTMYSPSQWWKPGFFSRFLNHEPKCECGAQKVKTTHSFWCSMYKKYK